MREEERWGRGMRARDSGAAEVSLAPAPVI